VSHQVFPECGCKYRKLFSLHKKKPLLFSNKNLPTENQ
jgi:hypothetical protein